jgi:DNA-binding CsgD family transcriptional regulator
MAQWSNTAALSAREHDVLRLLADGLSNEGIASDWDLR